MCFYSMLHSVQSLVSSPEVGGGGRGRGRGTIFDTKIQVGHKTSSLMQHCRATSPTQLPKKGVYVCCELPFPNLGPEHLRGGLQRGGSLHRVMKRQPTEAALQLAIRCLYTSQNLCIDAPGSLSHGVQGLVNLCAYPMSGASKHRRNSGNGILWLSTSINYLSGPED